MLERYDWNLSIDVLQICGLEELMTQFGILVYDMSRLQVKLQLSYKCICVSNSFFLHSFPLFIKNEFGLTFFKAFTMTVMFSLNETFNDNPQLTITWVDSEQQHGGLSPRGWIKYHDWLTFAFDELKIVDSLPIPN